MLLHNEDIAEMLYNRLLKNGYSPTEEECLALADIFFDLLIDLELLKELYD